MSSTNRGAERRADDAYETPAWCVHRLLDAAPDLLLRGRSIASRPTWLEPAVGSGAIVDAVNRWCMARPDTPMPSWLMQDIRDVPRRVLGEFVCGDFLHPFWQFGVRTPDVVCTNPPYSLAASFVERALSVCVGPVAMLLRLAWLSSDSRAPLMRSQAPDVFVLPNRPSFTGNGTDSADYAWFVWPAAQERLRAHGSIRVLATTPREERSSARTEATHG